MTRCCSIRLCHCTCVLVIVCSGCGNKGVLYRVGDVRRSIRWNADGTAQTGETRRMMKALRLYDEGEQETARQLAETLLDGECDAEATELLAVIDTQNYKLGEAAFRLEEAIKRHPGHSGLRKTLVWNLCEQHEYDRALLVATRAAEEIDEVSLWDVVAGVRQERRAWEQAKTEAATTAPKERSWFDTIKLIATVLFAIFLFGVFANLYEFVRNVLELDGKPTRNNNHSRTASSQRRGASHARKPPAESRPTSRTIRQQQ